MDDGKTGLTGNNLVGMSGSQRVLGMLGHLTLPVMSIMIPMLMMAHVLTQKHGMQLLGQLNQQKWQREFKCI
eukprot:1186164-Karenia_brevis.AAC.1